MSSEKIRRILASLVALVLAVGLVTHGVGRPEIASASAVIAANDMPMPSDMPMSGKCNGCAGDEKGMAPASCSAFCNTVIPSPLLVAFVDAIPADAFGPSAEPVVTGCNIPPDPYPPRPTILS